MWKNASIERVLHLQFFFLLKLGLSGTGCTSFQTQSSNAYDYFKLESIEDAKPIGYKVYFRLSVAANKTASVSLDSSGTDATSPFYKIRMIDVVQQRRRCNEMSLTICWNICKITEFDTRTNDTWIYRNDLMIAHVTFSITSEVANLVIAITVGK